MIGLINAGIVVRIAIHLFALLVNQDEKAMYVKKIKNCLIAFIIAMSIFPIKLIIEYYFK